MNITARMGARAARRWVACIVLALGALTRPVSGQGPPPIAFRVLEDTSLVQQVELRDGTKLVGRVVRIDGDQISFQTLVLDIQFRRRDAIRLRQVSGQRHGDEFWPEDPSDSRLFIAPTARVPRHGRGYFGVYELVVPSFGIGIGDRAMVSGGVSIIPGIDLSDQVFYIAPKLQLFDADYVQGAVGLFWVKPGSSEESAGMVYGGITAGDYRASFSGGIAFPFASASGFAEDPLVMLGGEMRASRSLKIITENWLIPGEEAALLSLGVRIIGSRTTVEAAAVTSTEGGFFPIVNFSVSW